MSSFSFNEKAYYKTIHWLFQRSRGLGAHFDLHRMEKSLNLPFLNQPHLSYPSVHIAGTNGKGSVSTKIAKAFEIAGYKVGLYTSPHISSICERIKINGTSIAPAQFLALFQKIEKNGSFEQFNLTFFEIVTLIAFQFFADEKVDIAIIETGLGGRLDATNVLQPLLSVITSIGFDHTAQLGKSLCQITKEKAGIIKENRPVVIGPSVPVSIIASIAKEKNAEVSVIPSQNSHYDADNSAIASSALEILSKRFQFPHKTIEEACAVRPSCRFEIVPNSVLKNAFSPSVMTFSEPIILDVAHNPDGIEQLCTMFQLQYPGKKAVVLFAASREKELFSMFQIASKKLLSPFFIFPNLPDIPRLFLSEELYKSAHLAGISEDQMTKNSSLEEALFSTAIAKGQEMMAPIIVTGSFFIMSKIRALLGYTESIDPLFSNEISL